MALSPPPVETILGSTTYPHRNYHAGLTEVRYAHPSGDNAKDGLTWGTAKADVVSAYDTLPSTGGTIYIADETYWDSVNTDRGLWLLNEEDPAYGGGSPTGGWRVRKPCSLIGVGTSYGGNAHHGVASNVRGGHATDRTKPSIWLAGGGLPIYFENINTAFPAVAWRIGITSAMTNWINTANITFRNCSFGLNKGVNAGPGVEIGYTFWLFFEHCSFGANDWVNTLTAATRSGTTATFTTAALHWLEVGDTVYVSGVTPSAYNGTWTVATAPTTTTFTATLATTPGGSGTVFGTAEAVKNYRRAGVAHEAYRWGTGQSSGLIHFESCNFNGGGFYYKPSGTTSWGQIVMRNITHEGDFASPEPPTLLVRTVVYGAPTLGLAGSGIYCQNIEVADAVGTPVAVEVEGIDTDPNLAVVVNAAAVGNVTQMPAIASRRVSGIDSGTFIGRHDGPRRSFAPAAVRYANLASHTLSGGSWTTGRSAPNGTTNASSITNTEVNHVSQYLDPAVGDWIIAGVWRRMRTLTTAVEADKPSVSFSHTDFVLDNTSSGFNILKPHMWDDGGWSWLCEGHQVVTAGTPSNQILLILRAGPGNVVDYFAPILIHIPASDGLDDDEVREIIRHLHTYPASAPVGVLSALAGQKLISPAGIGVGNSASATTVGSVTRKMEVFSETGASLGFVPIYDSIT